MKQSLALLLFLISSTAFSQINFEPGYYIDNNGNRTEGLIRNVAWKNNPVEFDFKISSDAEIQTIKIPEAKEFRVAGYKFRRYDLKIERSSYNVGRLDKSRNLNWIDETLYLKVLVEGDLSLYQYEDSNIIKYFYSNDGHALAEQLVFKEYVDQTIIKQVNQYKQQLFNLMKGQYPEMSSFEGLKYKKESLTDLFIAYNEAANTLTTDYTKTQNKGGLRLKFTPGVSFAASKVTNDLIPKAATKFDGKVTFRIGVELEYILPFNNNKWSLFVDPNYQSYKNEASQGSYNFKTEYNFVEIPMGIRHYMFITDKASIFIDAAYVLDFSVGDSYVLLNDKNPFEITKTTNFSVGAGFGYEKFSIEARQNFAHGILPEYQLWRNEFSTTNVIFGYRFL